MALALINESTLSDIADSIRLKLSSQDTYLPSEMPAAIESISGGGGGVLAKTVTFVVDGVNYAVGSVASGETLNAPAAPTKLGYRFMGWGTTTSATEYRSFPYVPTLETETLYAVWGAGVMATVTNLGNQSPAGVVITKDAAFPSSFEEWTDANNNVFVKIPTMWRKITATADGQITGFNIATAQMDSTYVPYPCFVAPDGVTVLPWVAIGKYCSTSSSAMNSVSGTPVSQTIGNARTNATTLGYGYQQYDWQLQKLFVDLTLVNYGNVDFNPGRTISNYLGIYNLDKDVWVDGVSKDGATWRFAKNPGNYIDNAGSSSQGYQAAGYTAPSSPNYISKLGYDASTEFFNYPSAVGGAQSTYYCDYYYRGSGNNPVFSDVGVAYADYGLWFCGASYAWSSTCCVRLCYRPLTA